MKLFPYQVEGVRALIAKKRFLLRDEPGLGKTCQLISGAKVIKAKAVLVVCPKSMVLTWHKEIKAWGADPKYFTIINHDKLIGKNSSRYIKKWDLVIADESHMYLKNIDTKRAKAFLEICELASVVWLATATVASRSGEDYYCTLKILLPSLMVKWTKFKFIKRYCRQVKDAWAISGFRYEGFQNMEELHKVFSVCSLKRKEEDVNLQLPELTETDMELPEDSSLSLDPEAIADIKQRIKDGVAIPEGYQGYMKAAGLKKIPYIIELLNTYPSDKNVVVFAWHRDVIKQLMIEIREHCENRCVDFIDGSVVDAEERQQRIDDFQGKISNTLLLNMQSGGAGITLTAATVGIYVQFPHSVIHWVQSRKRIHRIGSKKPVQLIKLISKGSIDEEIFETLTERAKYIKEIEG